MIIGIINSIAKAAENLIDVLDPGDEADWGRPPHCFSAEDTYRWLLAEARWLAGDVRVAAHQIRVREEWATFEHDSVQRACDEGYPPPDQSA